MPRMGPLPPSDPNASGPLPPSLLHKLEPSTLWDDQVEALQQLADLTIPLSKQANVDAIMRQLRPYGLNLAEAIQSPRSTLVKEACMCVETLAETFGPNFVAAVGIEVIPALLGRCSITKAIIRESAREAAKAMFEHGVEGVHLSTARLISQTVVDKQSPTLTRAAAAELIGLMLVERCRDGLSDIHDLVHNAIVEGCGDPDGTVREISRDNCSRLLRLDPALWERVFRDLPTHAKQYIAKPRDRVGGVDESVLPRRASMVPQRARPRHESMHTGMSVGLRGRYAPVRVQRASVNPVDLGSQSLFKDTMPPRVPNLPRPSRVDLDFRPNLPRKPFRPVLRPPRRSIAPFIPQNNINVCAVKEEPASTSPPLQSNTSTRSVEQDHVPSHTRGLVVEEKVSPKERILPEDDNPDSFQLESKTTKESIVGEGTEESGKHSLYLASPANSETKNACGESEHEAQQGESEDSSMGICLSAKSSKSRCIETDSTGTAEEAERAPIPSLIIRSPTETRSICGSPSPPQQPPAENKETKGNRNSICSPESTPFREGDGEPSNRLTESPGLKKYVNKGRLSFIMGVNQTPRVNRTASMGRPDMSIVKLIDSPTTPTNENAVNRTDEEKADTALTFDEANKQIDCAASSPSSVEKSLVAIEDESVPEESVPEATESSAMETRTPNPATSMVSESANQRATPPSQKMIDECERIESDDAESETKNAASSEASPSPESSDSELTQDEKPKEAQACHGRSDSTEQLLKTPQMGMPDIPDFAKLMEDIEKQTLCNVAPAMSLAQKAEVMNRAPVAEDGAQNGSEKSDSDKENADDGSARKERRVQLNVPQAIRRDAADMKPPQKSRAASFKGRPPRRSLMPQAVTTGAGLTAGSTRVETGETKDDKKDMKELKSGTKRDEVDTRKGLVRKTSDSKVGRGTGRSKGAEKTRSGAVGKTVRSGWTSGVGTTRASVLRARENTGNTKTQVGRADAVRGEARGAAKVEKRKKSVLPAKTQEVVDALRACNRAKNDGWQAKSESLKRFEVALRAVAEEKMPARLAEDCVYMLGEYIVDGHHKVVVGALEGFFYLFLCSVGGVQSRALQRALERRIESLRRILQLTRDCKEDTRLASERVLDGFGVQFEPEAQVGVVMQAMTSEKGRSKMVDGRVATSGCALLVRAFERADRNEGGFVWKAGLLEVIVSVLGRLSKDRRVEVRRAAGPVVAAVKQCLPDRAFEMACRKVGVQVRGMSGRA
ncbi:hypothetical protein BWQ96_05443 [Gracilariopsis chorda]|uniref:TOG domain-containing protein n=1 Tax=Gracilariopsis chorda TaxID=448386 RepID=A0A2V3IRP7_9FLOR|nr:hypothetical protein BWQ96_05443 [Gracilariopsis chorda]|eukprot:PXF44773.1 hypothetical protein BWQ96_05443 [Gracilariopsis chorda]